MSSRPRLVRSIPFWGLIAGSLASGIAGTMLLTDRLGAMASALTDGTATGIEVYVGQIEAVFGAILVGAGIVGLALALTVASIRSFVPSAPVAAPLAPVESADRVEPVASAAPVASPAPAAPAASADSIEDGAAQASATGSTDAELAPAEPRN